MAFYSTHRFFTTADTEEHGSYADVGLGISWAGVGDGSGVWKAGSADFAGSGDSGHLHFGDQAVGMRCAGRAAQVQECAGDVSQRVRGDCGEEVGVGETSRAPLLAQRTREKLGTPGRGKSFYRKVRQGIAKDAKNT